MALTKLHITLQKLLRMHKYIKSQKAQVQARKVEGLYKDN